MDLCQVSTQKLYKHSKTAASYPNAQAFAVSKKYQTKITKFLVT